MSCAQEVNWVLYFKIRPLIQYPFFSVYPVQGHRDAGVWTCCQSVTGLDTDKHLHSQSHLWAVLELPVNQTQLTAHLWTESWSPQREPTHTQGEHANGTRLQPDGSNNHHMLPLGHCVKRPKARLFQLCWCS